MRELAVALVLIAGLPMHDAGEHRAAQERARHDFPECAAAALSLANTENCIENPIVFDPPSLDQTACLLLVDKFCH